MDSTTARLMAQSAVNSNLHLDSLATSLRLASDWFALRHDLIVVFSCAVLGLSFVLSAWVFRK